MRLSPVLAISSAPSLLLSSRHAYHLSEVVVTRQADGRLNNCNILIYNSLFAFFTRLWLSIHNQQGVKMKQPVQTQKPIVKRKAHIRKLTVRHLRELLSAVTPCPATQAHIKIEKRKRAQLMLDNLLPIFAEHPDGTLEVRGYASTIAALLHALSPNEEIEVLIRPVSTAAAGSMIPLALEFNHRLEPQALRDFTSSIFDFWGCIGVKNVPIDAIASELSLSATTYSRKVGWQFRDDLDSESE